jgi:hypothetical protein
MTKFTKLALAALLGMAVMTTTASADADKGQKIYSKKLKETCAMDGGKFAAKHTQDEWTAIIEEEKLADEITSICGEGAAVKEKKLGDLGDFVTEFASDSGNVPNC